MRVFGEHAAGITRGGFLPRFLALFQFGRRHVEGQFPFLGVNDDVLTDNSGNFRVVVYY